MSDIVIVAALRTAVGKFGGSLARTPAPELGATVIKALLAQTKIEPQAISGSGAPAEAPANGAPATPPLSPATPFLPRSPSPEAPASPGG